MSKARVKLAQLTDDDLHVDGVQVVETAPKQQVVQPAPPAEVQARSAFGLAPDVSDAIKALLIMAGCEAVYAGNHWVVRKTKVSEADEKAYALSKGGNRSKLRYQTAVGMGANFEDWRREVNALVGGFGPPLV